MKKMVIVGAGGFGREVKMLIDQINDHKLTYEIEGFYDDDENLGDEINGLPLLGSWEDLSKRTDEVMVALGVATPKAKQKVVRSLSGNNFSFPILIHPSALIGKDGVKIGKGSVICAYNIITCNIVIEDFVTLNLSCTTGHDATIHSFSSFMPSVNISGEVTIRRAVYVGTGTQINNQLEIGENTIVGSGAVVVKSLPANCTAIGIPAKPLKFHQ